MKKVKVSSLVRDFDLYPRNNLDPQIVRCIGDAMDAGVKMPPIVIDKKTRKVVDGFHRIKAVLDRNPDGYIEIVEKTYANDSEMFLDAMRYNASHGARLDTCDRTHCLLVAERLSIDITLVAGALHMPIDKLGSLRVERTAVSAGGLEVAIKRTIDHKAGEQLTKIQIDANEKLSGMNQSFYANQLITLIESDLLDKEDEKLMVRLGVLNELLNGLFAKV